MNSDDKILIKGFQFLNFVVNLHMRRKTDSHSMRPSLSLVLCSLKSSELISIFCIAIANRIPELLYCPTSSLGLTPTLIN